MKRLLFICWDGAIVNYLEGLFLPILKGLRKNYEVYIIQFTWSDADKIANLKNTCDAAGVKYFAFPVSRKPHPLPATVYALVKGISYIKHFIEENKIDIIMPRSTMPALMMLRVLKNKNYKIIFDADGFPLEERVDFSGLKPSGFLYRYLKNIETTIIKKADIVITRTTKARYILSAKSGKPPKKFFVVINGRDTGLFKPDASNYKIIRQRLGLKADATLIIYAGSLGPQYCTGKMIEIYKQVRRLKDDTYFLILTGNDDYLYANYSELKNDKHVIVKTVPFAEVPVYLAAGNVGLALREPVFSMKGVAPIKIGEYLLSGLPVVVSGGIGDTEEVLRNENSCFVLKNHEPDALEEAAKWIKELEYGKLLTDASRKLGLEHFDLQSGIHKYELALNALN